MVGYKCMSMSEKKNISIYYMNNNLSVNNMSTNIPLPSRQDVFNLRLNRLLTGQVDRITFRATNVSQVRNIVQLLLSAGQDLVLRFGETYYVLNQNTRFKLRNKLNDLLIGNFDEIGSDEELIQNIQSNTISIERVNGTNTAVSQGGFFKYYHKLDGIDLTRFGLYQRNDNMEADLKDNCFIRSLISYGIDDDKINECRLILRSRNIKRNNISDICKKLNIHVSIKPIGLKKYNIYHIGDKTLPEIKIGQIDEHYFHITDSNITSYAIKNYDEIKHLDNWNHIFAKQNGKYLYKKSRTTHSYNLIKYLYENQEKHLEKIELDNTIYKTQYHDMFDIDDITNLQYNIDDNIKSNEYKVRKDKDTKGDEISYVNLYFDFETTTDGDRHIEYLCCVCDEQGKTKTFYGKESGKELLNYCSNKYGDNIRLIAHNCTYDYRFIYKYLYGLQELAPHNRLMTCKAIFYYKKKKINVMIKDSYALISSPLKSFKDMFKLEMKKEILPYRLYNRSNVLKQFINIKECKQHVEYQYECNNIGEDYNSEESIINKQKFVDEYINNCNEWDCIDGETIDIIKYSQKYCEMDCIVLMQGYKQFRNWIKQSTGLDINQYPSLASVSNDYLVKEGCYDEVMMLSGIPRAFIQKCMIGGRTMLNSNQKQIVNDGRKIADFDGVSLYPSSMILMDGFLKGMPKVIETFEPNKYDGYFIQILITKVNKDLQFPLLNKLDDKGIRLFTNDMEGDYMYVDKTTLEDLIEFHKIEYKFIRGYYYDEGFNTKIKEVIQGLFDTRLKYKKEGNPIQAVYKLLMNSGYGKAGLKPVDEDTKYIRADDFDKEVKRQYNFIKEIVKINDKMYKFKYYKSLEKHYNNIHVAVSILSYSKRIMCQVMCLAEDHNLNMYYTDTDSIHIDYDQVEKLGIEFKNKYNKELIGKNIGQFHIDFDDKLQGRKCDNVYSDYLIALGKKIYVDRLVGTDIKTGDKVYDYHIRLKGVSNNSILHKARKDYGGDIMKLYEDLTINKVDFDLLCDGMKCSFDMRNDLTITNRDKFERTINVCG